MLAPPAFWRRAGSRQIGHANLMPDLQGGGKTGRKQAKQAKPYAQFDCLYPKHFVSMSLLLLLVVCVQLFWSFGNFRCRCWVLFHQFFDDDDATGPLISEFDSFRPQRRPPLRLATLRDHACHTNITVHHFLCNIVAMHLLHTHTKFYSAGWFVACEPVAGMESGRKNKNWVVLTWMPRQNANRRR